MPIQVVLADDYPVIRKGIKNILDATSDIKVVAETGEGEEAVELVQRLEPDVLVLDMNLPGIDGVEVIRRLKVSNSPVRILAFSGYDDREYVLGTLNAGAAGYLTKDESVEGIVDAIRGIANGQQGWLSRRIKAIMMGVYIGEGIDGIKITPREAEVCKLITKGRTNQSIAYELHISEKTVEKYLDSLFRKFDVVSRVQLAVLLVREETNK